MQLNCLVNLLYFSPLINRRQDSSFQRVSLCKSTFIFHSDRKKNINRPSITVTFQGKMLPVCNWLSDHLLVLKGEVQMA